MSGVVHVVRTGTANLASVLAALERAGARPRVTADPAEVASAPIVVLPGVGAFGAAMENLSELAPVLADRVRAGRPTLGICLGLQLLGEGSDETPGVVGLGVVPRRAERLRGEVRVPQLGWNRVTAQPGCALLEDGYAYYANSYAWSAPAPEGWAAAVTEHGVSFLAAVERGAVLACQFHPELSGAWGAALLSRWLARAKEAAC
ncbi:MAG TPA: imidazole glycerol phosphate synthase subunit HisH [Candidatus Polarisedimenticolaceae bacterium]